MLRSRRTIAVLLLFAIESIVAIPMLSVGQTGRVERRTADTPTRRRRRCKRVRRPDGRIVKRCRRLRPRGKAPQKAPAPGAAKARTPAEERPAPPTPPPGEAPPALAPVPPAGPPPLLAPVPPEEEPFRLPEEEEAPAGPSEPPPSTPGPGPEPAPPSAPTASPEAAPPPTQAPARGPEGDSLTRANAPPEVAPPPPQPEPTRRRPRCKLVRKEDGTLVRRCRRRCKRVTLESGRVVKRCRRRRRAGGAGAPPGGAAIAGGVGLEDEVPGAVGDGPRFQAGWRLYYLTDFHDEGTTNAFDLTIYPLQGHFRLGLTGEVGIRDLSVENDIVVRSYASLGYQSPGRWTPYIVGVVGGGVIAFERFGINEWAGLFTAGLEGGAEVRLGNHALLGAALGLQRTVFIGAQYDSITFRASLGF